MSEDNINQMDWAILYIPPNQYNKVLSQDMCDIDQEFLGFLDQYIYLAKIIPKHFTVIDFGCAYAPQAFCFTEHKRYIGVDISDCQRFKSDNTKHYKMSTDQWIEKYLKDIDVDETFAICTYVPPCVKDSITLVKENFKNVYTFYPHGTKDL